MLLFVLITLGCASASDLNQSDDMMALEDATNEILTEDIGTFSDLNDKISNSQTKTIELTKDYTYDVSSDTGDSGIMLTSNMTIDGKGHTLNGNNKTRIFKVQSGPVTIKNTIFINAKCTLDGGGAIEADKTSIILKNCTFIGNQGKHGGAVNAKSATIENCTFTQNKGTNGVGAVSAENGVVTDCRFSENEGSTGALIILENGKTFNSEFISNTGRSGAGAIYYKDGSTTENCIFIGNKVENEYYGEGSGAIYQYYKDPQRIVNCTFINNTDTDVDGNWDDYYFNDEIHNRFLIKNNATIINCTFVNTKVIWRNAENYYSEKTYHVLFENNTFIDSKVNLTECNASFSKNTFENSFISNNGAEIISPTYFEVPNYIQKPENTLILARMIDDAGNTIYDNGYLKDCFKFLVNNEEFTSIEYVKINDIWYYQVNTTLSEGNYSVNVVLTNETGLKQYYADCTLIAGNLRVGDIANFTELENEIRTQGNDITLEKDYALNITDEIGYINGIVIDMDNVIIDGKGHSISGSNLARIFNITGNNVTLKNITFENGKAYSGGAINASGKITLEDCRFINNNANNGGAVYLSDGNITNCQFIKNTASKNGGAIYLDKGSISHSEFINNSAENGGAVNINNGTITDSNFTDNIASQNGGANYINEGNITNSNFTDNIATQNGGAIYLDEGNITNSTFIRNSAVNGGAVYFNNKGSVIESNFTYNNAEEAGAVYFNNEGSVIESNFTYNNAYNGILYFKEKGNITNSTFENNTAEKGIIIVEDLLTITNTTFENNTIYETNVDIILINEGEVILDNVIPEDIQAKHNIYLYADCWGAPYSEDVEIHADVTADNEIINTGYVFVTINNSTYTANVENGSATIIIPNLDIGDYTVEVGYNGAENYLNPRYEVEFSVFTLDWTITPSTTNFNINTGGIYTARLTTYGDPMYDTNVTLALNGVIIGCATTDWNGVLNFQLTPEILKNGKIGANDLTISFNDYPMFLPNASQITINKDSPTITAKTASYVINYGGKYSLTIKDSAGKPVASEKVTFTLNGKNIGTAVTDANGVATITLTASMLKTAKAGTKNLVVKTTENSILNSVSKTIKIKINKEKVKITAKKKTFKKSVKTKKYAITLKNSKGKAIKKVKVTLKINGKTYTAKTNNKGKAVFKIKKLTKKGKYTANVTFKTTATYLKASKKVRITLK